MSAPCQCLGPDRSCGPAGYNRGCRCDYCREVHSIRQRRLRTERLERPLPPSVVHGRYTTYVNWGCRCTACVQARSEQHVPYIREWRKQAAKRARQHPEQVPHGTLYGYQGWGCRCDDCKAAKREVDRRQRAKQKR